MLNESFENRMKALLGDGYGDFAKALERDAVRGVRVNTIKCTAEKLLSVSDLTLEPITYIDNGFILRDSSLIGSSPEHHAGMIYMQDPGAMSALSAIDIHEGEWALDMCAAPGGKSSQIAERIGDSGFLLSNEFVPKRAKTVVGNFERLGVRNAMVTSLDTSALPKLFSEAFDLVVCDAPCSGEGMFRKNDDAVSMWSEENVNACAKRQAEILENAVPLLKCGGRLVYSTCTYSVEENEAVVAALLDSHPELELIPVREELRQKTSDGINFDGKHPTMTLARRFYPHVSEGEGQFVAVMKKRENVPEKSTILYKDAGISPTKVEVQIVNNFFNEVFSVHPSGRFIKQGELIVMILHDCPIPPRSVFMAGVAVGEISHGILKPHHQLFSAFGTKMKNRIELLRGDIRVEKYLRGEEIDCPDAKAGYASVLYEGIALGGGKVSGGRLKNHYPKGLRNK